MSRRGLLGWSAAVPVRRLLTPGNRRRAAALDRHPAATRALLRWRPDDFQVNRTSAAAAITDALVGPAWRLNLTGGTAPVSLDAAALAALPPTPPNYRCLRGGLVGDAALDRGATARPGRNGGCGPGVRPGALGGAAGAFNAAALTGAQVLHPDALLATHVNGAPLSRDHGFRRA